MTCLANGFDAAPLRCGGRYIEVDKKANRWRLNTGKCFYCMVLSSSCGSDREAYLAVDSAWLKILPR